MSATDEKQFESDVWLPASGLQKDAAKAAEIRARKEELEAGIACIKATDLIQCVFTISEKNWLAVANRFLLSHEIKEKNGNDVVVQGYVVWDQYARLKAAAGVKELKFANPLNQKQFIYR